MSGNEKPPGPNGRRGVHAVDDESVRLRARELRRRWRGTRARGYRRGRTVSRAGHDRLAIRDGGPDYRDGRTSTMSLDPDRPDPEQVGHRALAEREAQSRWPWPSVHRRRAGERAGRAARSPRRRRRGRGRGRGAGPRARVSRAEPTRLVRAAVDLQRSRAGGAGGTTATSSPCRSRRARPARRAGAACSSSTRRVVEVAHELVLGDLEAQRRRPARRGRSSAFSTCSARSPPSPAGAPTR